MTFCGSLNWLILKVAHIINLLFMYSVSIINHSYIPFPLTATINTSHPLPLGQLTSPWKQREPPLLFSLNANWHGNPPSAASGHTTCAAWNDTCLSNIPFRAFHSLTNSNNMQNYCTHFCQNINGLMQEVHLSCINTPIWGLSLQQGWMFHNKSHTEMLHEW